MISKEMNPRTKLVNFETFSRHLQRYCKNIQTVDTMDAWREFAWKVDTLRSQPFPQHVGIGRMLPSRPF
jgi:hypothetical protein